jgi:hypothetical protein
MDSSLLYRELTTVYSKEGMIDMSNFPLSKLVDKRNTAYKRRHWRQAPGLRVCGVKKRFESEGSITYLLVGASHLPFSMCGQM